MLDQALQKPKPIPPEPTIQERLLKCYENSAMDAYFTMYGLLNSPKDEIKFNASRFILEKVGPEKVSEQFAFLSKKGDEELIGIISGSGFLTDAVRALVERAAVDATKRAAGSLGEESSRASGIQEAETI